MNPKAISAKTLETQPMAWKGNRIGEVKGSGINKTVSNPVTW